MAYTDPKTGSTYPSYEWMVANIQNLPEVQKAYPNLMTPTPAPTPAPAPTPPPTQPTIPTTPTVQQPYQYTNPITGQIETAPSKEWYEANKGLLFPGTPSYTGVSTGTTPQTIITGPTTPTPAPAGYEIPAIPSISDLTQPGLTAPAVTTGTFADAIAYTTGLTAEVQQYRTQLENLYSKQIEDLKIQQEASQKRIDELTAKEETLIKGDIQTLLQPYREALEKSERERLKIEENYFANQESIAELEQLLTQGQADIEAAEAVTGLAAIRSPRIAKIKEDIAARAGIIQAVMAARNNQISVATNLIDRTANAIASDRNGQLTYYQTLLNFYDKQRDEEGNKLLNLTNEEKAYVNAQINLIQNDLAQAQDTYNYVKQMMLDPNTADMMARSGVTLNDSVATIQQKLSQYTYQQEVRDVSNQFEAQGYEYLPLPQQQMGKPEEELIRFVDSRGVERVYWKKAEVETTGYTEFTPQELRRLEQVGIDPTNRQQALDYLYGEPSPDKVGVPTVEDFVNVFQPYKDAGYPREDVERQYKAENKIKEDETLPTIVIQALDKVYGITKKWWEFWK